MHRTSTLLCLLLLAIGAPASAGEPGEGRVVVLAFEGLDARVTERLMGEGHLPELAELAGGGGYARLVSPPPAVTSSSWATFATGRDPGEAGIVDLVTRDPETYRLTSTAYEVADRAFLWGERTPFVLMGVGAVLGWLVLFLPLRLVSVRWSWVAAVAGAVVVGGAGYWIGEHWVPKRVGEMQATSSLPTFWELAGEVGVAAEVLRVPGTFPPRPARNVRVLAGFNVPDLAGRSGDGVLYASDEETTRVDRDAVRRMIGGAGRYRAVVEGPVDPCSPSRARLTTPAMFVVSQDRSMVEVSVGGHSALLRVGEWSPWMAVRFRSNPLLTIDGVVRFRALALTPELKMLRTAVHPDPDRLPPGLTLSSPSAWAETLWTAVGPFATAGWTDLGRIGCEGLVAPGPVAEMIGHRVDGERRILNRTLQGGARLVVHHFEFVDRLIHLPSPGATGGGVGSADEIAMRAYREADDIVGHVRTSLGASDTLLVVSNHGCSSPWRGVDLNAWLLENGYLALLPDRDPGVARLPDDVDWSATRAYAVGFGGVYVNVAGRERAGIVERGREYDRVCESLKNGLSRVVDSRTGARAVERVASPDELYRWFDESRTPDLLVTTSEGYGIAWDAAMGAIGDLVVHPSPPGWSCTHGSVAPELIPGVLFANRPLDRQRVEMVDVAPTVLRLLGVQPPVRLRGRPFVRTSP